ncbi:hypothetical protein [Terribacillus saccharophilus]|uniref:Uncharacterized protein n=1 Tax=Terribacillus saccharophilus TaxID=361277 RepID=A0ABX4H0D0_9BACI|nr:hypothetical protein [Terribacillus saccharophilus]PAD35991.1 hypothetical protein CHH56_06080 [Terribacillus saccharophilus]PAD96958.1 hypothetical protein CHH50_06230 [Terribacillus saccharophilus]PAE00534.1 hypothetical protein CHH48_07135 [Terribacillus saccharophilus]
MKEPLYRRIWFIILWLVLFFPIGLVLMWISKKWTRVTRTIITIGVITLAIIGFVKTPDSTTTASADETKEEGKAEPVVVEEEVPKENEEQEVKEETKASLDQSITKSINKVAGEETNMDGKRIKELEINDNMGTEEGDDKIVIASLRADDNFSESYIKAGIEDDSSRLFEKLFQNEEVSNVVLDWYFPLVDQSGNEEESVINTIGMTRETFEKIKWDNFNRDNYPNIADDYFIHPVLNK